MRFGLTFVFNMIIQVNVDVKYELKKVNVNS